MRVVIDAGNTPAEAKEYGVPRYNFTVKGAAGVLGYGDAAGRRIDETELTRSGSGWLVGRRTVCSGPGGRPSPDPLELGRHTASPLPLDPRAAQSAATGETGPAQQFAFPGGRTLYTVVPTSRLDGDSLVTVHRTSSGDDRPRRF